MILIADEKITGAPSTNLGTTHPHRNVSHRQPPTIHPSPNHRRPAVAIISSPQRFPSRRPSRIGPSTPFSDPASSSVTASRLILTLPIPPSINHQYATVNGRRILSSKGRQYKTAIAQYVLTALAQSPRKKTLLSNLRSHTLNLSLTFFFTSSLRRDLDGGLKIAQDAICGALGLNDNRITEIHLFKAIDKDFPRMECELALSAPFMIPTRKTGKRGSSLGSPLPSSTTRPHPRRTTP